MKLKSPLLSFSASGSLADQITFLNIRGSTYAKTKQGPIGGTSPAQLEQRAKFKAGCEFSHTLTPEQKAYWHSVDIRSASCSWFNNFMSAFILDPGQFEVSMIDSLQYISLVIPHGETSVEETINSVNLDSTVLLHLGNPFWSKDADRYLSHLELTSTTTVEASTLASNPTYDVDIKCLVIEFTPSLIKSCQYFSGAIPYGARFSFNVIDEVDLNKVLIFPAGARIVATPNVFNYVFSFEFVDPTRLKLYRAGTYGNLDCYCFILELK